MNTLSTSTIVLVLFCVIVSLFVLSLMVQRLKHKRAQRLLRNNEERYLQALESSTDGLWNWDAVSDRVYYSQRFLETIGESLDDHSETMTSFRDRFHPDDADAAMAAMERHIRDRAPFNKEFRLRNRSGEYRWFLTRGQAVWNNAGQALRMSGWIQDITERKQSELAHQSALFEIQDLKERLEAERAYLQEEIKSEYNYDNIIGNSDGINYVFYKIQQIASTDTTILISGETGTGKELVARAVHSSSLRRERALVKINCATLPAALIESELFGHEKGSFTGAHTRQVGRFEVANGATLFLDEIGELPLELQPKLLRVLQDGEFERLGSTDTIKVDVRIIAATNRNLEEEVKKGRFREDLWYRLNVFPITVPPLRERSQDISLLVDHFVHKIAKRLGKSIKTIPTAVMKELQNYHWPGNVRELENVLERAVINSSGPKLHLMDELKKHNTSAPYADMELKPLKEIERDYIIRVLEHTQWKVSGKNGAAEILGLDRSTLRARMRKLNIVKP